MLNEMIHKYLDGEMPDNEKKILLENTTLKEEVASFEAIIDNARRGHQVNASEGFVSRVMNRVNQTRTNTSTGLIQFLLEPRILHWNMASAITAVLIVAVSVTAVLFWQQVPKETVIIEQTVALKEPEKVYVRFFLHMPDAKEIFMCGDFNDWKSNEIRLTKAQESGLWTVTIPLYADKTYQYMFVVDGNQWMPDPLASVYLDDGFGSKNSVIDLRKNMW